MAYLVFSSCLYKIPLGFFLLVCIRFHETGNVEFYFTCNLQDHFFFLIQSSILDEIYSSKFIKEFIFKP